MYKQPQQRSQSRTPITTPKTSENQYTTGNFRVPPQTIGNSQPQTEIKKYSPELADLLAAKIANTTIDPEFQGDAIQRMRQNSTPTASSIQTKLSVGEPGDKYEQEADSMASKVMSMPDSAVQRQTSSGEEVENKIQRKIIMRAPDRSVLAGGNIESQLNSSQGGGNPLSEEVRAYMEPRFGADFSQVQVHTDTQAVQMNRELGAQAFTHGSNIYYGAGKAPGVNELTAHELTHVVQQTGISQISGKVNQQSNINKSLPSVTFKAPSTIVQRDIKGSGQVHSGEFNINMIKQENPSVQSGEQGTIEFKPNAKAPNSKSIRLIQVVKMLDLGQTPANDYNWQGSESNRNNMRTSASSETYTSKKGDTLKSISDNKCKGHITSDEIYQANKTILTNSDSAAVIPEGTLLSIPKIQGGYFVDHFAGGPNSVPRTNAKDKEVSPYYRDHAPSPKVSQDGFKQGKNIQGASLWDFPGAGGSSFHLGFNFETVARSEDIGIDYGTIHWNFTLDQGKVKDESFHVQQGTSTTFQAGLQEFNKFYKNPHTVMRGETLQTISQKYYGVADKSQDIYKANKDVIKNPDNIQPGLKLRIPNFSA